MTMDGLRDRVVDALRYLAYKGSVGKVVSDGKSDQRSNIDRVLWHVNDIESAWPDVLGSQLVEYVLSDL